MSYNDNITWWFSSAIQTEGNWVMSSWYYISLFKTSWMQENRGVITMLLICGQQMATWSQSNVIQTEQLFARLMIKLSQCQSWICTLIDMALARVFTKYKTFTIISCWNDTTTAHMVRQSTQREAKLRSGNHGDQLSFRQHNSSVCALILTDLASHASRAGFFIFLFWRILFLPKRKTI